MMPTVEVEVNIRHSGNTYTPVVIGELTVEWTRFASPGKMNLTVFKDDALKFEEGDVVTLKVDGQNFFYGFLFTYERTDSQQYKLTCYDALRYLKSQDVFKMKRSTYAKALKNVCSRYGLKKGTIMNTRHACKAKVFTGTVIDMLEYYRKKTKSATGDNYILYMDFDQVCLVKQDKMVTEWAVTAETAESFSYSSSIDDDVYTVIKLYRNVQKKKKKKKKKGKKNITVTRTYSKTLSAEKKKYGRLTYVESVKTKKKAKINKRLKKIANAHKKPKKKLSFNGVFGIKEIRAGSGMQVKLSVVGMDDLTKSMVVNRVTHRFNEGFHTMDLTMVGGVFKDG